MNTVKVFRLLIILSLVLSIAGAAIDFIFPGLVPPALSEAYAAHTAAEPSLTFVMVAAIFMLALLAVAIVATIGLLVLQRWARSLALWTTILSFAAYPFLGAVVYSGIAQMLITISMTLWGAGLAMAYYSDVRGHFERRAQ